MAEQLLTLRVNLNPDGTIRGARQVKDAISGIGAEGEKAGARAAKGFRDMGVAIGAAVAAAGAAVVALTKQAINQGDEFAKMSVKVGASVESLSTLAYAAEQAGASTGQLQQAMVFLARNANEAASGNARTAASFSALGISVKDSNGNLRATDDLLREAVAGMSGLENETQRVKLAMDLFGRSGAELLPFLTQTAEGLAEAEARARALGGVWSNDGAKAAEFFNDRLSDMQVLFKGIFIDAAEALLPLLNTLAAEFVDNGIKAREAANGASRFAEFLKNMAEVALRAVGVVQKLGAIVGASAQQFVTFGNVLRQQFAALGQYQRDIFDIGPIDAFTKLMETGFGNAASGINQARLNLEALGDTFADIDAKTQTRIKALREGMLGVAEATGKKSGAAGAMVELREEAAKALPVISGYDARLSELAALSAEFKREQEELAAQLAGPSAEAALAYSRELERLTELLFIGAINSDDARLALANFAAAQEQAAQRGTRAVRETAKEFTEAERIGMNFYDSLARAAGDFATGQIRSFREAFDALRDIARQALSDLVAQFIRTKLPLNFTGGAGGAGGMLGGGLGGALGSAALGFSVGGAGGGIGGLLGNLFGGTSAGSALFGGIGAALGVAVPVIGSIVGTLLGSLFSSNKPPDIRLGGVGVTRKPEGTATSQLGQFQFGARGLEGGERQLVDAVIQFDNSIAQIVQSISGGDEQLQRIRDALAQWSIDLRGDAVTAENVLGARFGAILSTFDQDVQQFVRGAGDLQAQVQALAEVLSRPDQLRDLLSALRLDDQLAGMSQLERQVFGVNQAFDQAAAQAAALGATTAQLAEIEELRERALGRLTGTLVDQTRDAARIADILGGLAWDAALAGMSDLDRQLAETTRRFDDLAAQLAAAGAGEKELAELRQREAEALGRIIAADAAAQLERFAEAAQQIAEIVGGIDAALADINAASDYQRALLGIGRQLRANIDQLNAAARAAGLQAAREEDLARAHQLAAAQAAQALATLTQAGQQQAAALYGSALGDIESRIAELTRIGGGALSGFGNAITETARAASDATRLLLGDLSPLKDAQKLPLALQALQRGEIGGDDVLRIAQRLYASGSDYNRVFAQVQQIVGSRQIAEPTGPGAPMEDPRLAALYAERDRLMAEQAQFARFGQAQQFAQTLADIAGSTGEGFGDVLGRLSGGRGSLDQLAADLQLASLDALDEYLRGLSTVGSPADIAAQITAGEQLIVDTLREIGGLDGEIVKPGGGALLKQSIVEAAAEDPLRQENAELRQLVRELIDAIRTGSEGQREAVEIGTDATVSALHAVAEAVGARPLAGESPTDTRSVRKPGAYWTP